MSRIPENERERWLTAVGLAIRELRTRMGVSQEALGYKAGLHRTYVSDVERGQRNPTVATLRDLAVTLDSSCGEILGRAEEIFDRDTSL
jgi:transcriptional regulator with XRE-family HTH domain